MSEVEALKKVAEELERIAKTHDKLDYCSPSPLGKGYTVRVGTDRSNVLRDIAHAIRKVANKSTGGK